MFKFELTQGSAVSNITLDAPLSNWEQYRNSLKNFQKGVNELLTLVIERNKNKATDTEADDIEVDSSDSEEEKAFSSN